MSNEEKHEIQMNDEKRAFIREQIAPKRRSAFKRFIGSVGRTSFLAILFGAIGSLVFSGLNPYFDELFGNGEEDPVVLVQPSPSPEPSVAPSPSPEPSKEPEDVQEELPAVIDMESYAKVYALIQELAKEVNQSIVTVSGVQSGYDWFDNPAEAENVTSGVLVADTEKKLFVLSSFDKIAGVSRIQITFQSGESVEGTLQGSDKDTNIAVIAVPYEEISKETQEEIEIADLGDSYYAQTGVPILALGNPNGYMYSVMAGMVTVGGIEQYITDGMIEMFSTNMDSSSKGEGVIVDLDGRILGIITHHFDEELNNSMCAAISINRVKSMIEKLINGSKRAYFGVIASNIPDEIKEQLGAEHGVYVTEVKNNSPALDAGIKTGDIITDINQTEITSIANFTGTLSVMEPKETIKVKLIRTSQAENKKKVVELVVGNK